MTDDDDRFVESARHALNRSADDLDPATRARLRQARYRALDAVAMRVRRPWRYAVGGAALAAAALALSVTLWLDAPPGLKGARPPEIALVDIDLLATHESPEFYTELEFLNWLEDGDAG